MKLFGLALLFFCCCVQAQTAREQAATMSAMVEKAQKDLKVAIETNDRNGYVTYISAPLAQALRKWNDAKGPEAGRYSACAQATLAFQRYGQTFFTDSDGVWNREWRDQRAREYKERLVECKASLRAANK
jgi:hypothetical protein